MIRTKTNRFLCGMMVILLGFSLFVKTSTIQAASSGQTDKISLHAGNTYRYDLNGDGKKEKIVYQSIENEKDFTSTCKIYVNDKLCYHKTAKESFCFDMYLCDLDVSDSFLDIYIDARTYSDGVTYSKFARYDGSKITEYCQLSPESVSKYFKIFRYGLGDIRGDGTFQVVVDSPIYSETIGCYNCFLEFKMVEDKLTPITTNFYYLNQDSKKYPYKAAKSFISYTKVGSKTTAFIVKKGDTITFDKLYVSKSGKLYVRIRNQKGKNGWMSGSLKDLFVEIPAWG